MDKERGEYFNKEPKFWSWLSSQLRKVWRTHPTKTDFIKHVRFIKKVGNRPLYHIKCVMCEKDFQLKDIEINHKVKCGNVKSEGYALRMLDVGFSDLEPLCKPCHSVVTYSERMGITVQEAALEKEVIKFSKLSIYNQKHILGDSSKAKNAKQRKEEFRNKLLKEYSND